MENLQEYLDNSISKHENYVEAYNNYIHSYREYVYSEAQYKCATIANHIEVGRKYVYVNRNRIYPITKVIRAKYPNKPENVNCHIYPELLIEYDNHGTKKEIIVSVYNIRETFDTSNINPEEYEF